MCLRHLKILVLIDIEDKINYNLIRGGIAMAKKEVMNANIEPFTLNNKQIKNRIEDTISYDHEKYADLDILFTKKKNSFQKLPFSDFKVAISQELDEQKLLIQQLQEYDLIEENVVNEEVPETVEEVKVEEDSKIDVIDEIYDFDEESKKPAPRYRSKVKQSDTEAVVARIKAEAREKNKGKKVITRRDINKELKPYMIKRAAGMNINDDALTSIDIYLNAVNKIESVNSAINNEDITQPDPSLELNLDDILNDLDK